MTKSLFHSSMLDSNFAAEQITSIQNGITTLRLAVNAPVLIRKNFCPQAGVLNGALGRVVYIYTPTDEEARNGSVECIIVSIDGYRGSMFVSTPNGDGLPIFRVQASEIDEAEGVRHQYRVFPLSLAYSFTLHKIQGKGFPKLSFHLGCFEMSHNLDYTAFSRVSDWKNIMILDAELKPERLLRGTFSEDMRAQQIAEEERLKELEREFLSTIN